MKRIIYWILLVAVTVLLFGTVTIYMQRGNNHIEFFQILSGFSTFIVAILTAAYVLTTNNQLAVMEKQLEEMSKGRELENQPFPWIENPIFKIEKPKVYYSPPHNEAEILSLYRIEYKIKNIGKGAAVGIFIDPKFIVDIDSDKFEYDCVTRKIEVIEEGKYYEYEKPWFDNCNMVSITSDIKYLTLKSLIKGKILNLPKFHVIIYYRNFLGATFRINCSYNVMRTLDPTKPGNDMSIVRDWLSKLTDAQVKFSTELKQVEATFPIDQEEGRRKFTAIKTNFNTMIGGSDPEEINLPVVLISENYNVSIIGKEEYETKIKELLEDDERRRYAKSSITPA